MMRQDRGARGVLVLVLAGIAAICAPCPVSARPQLPHMKLERQFAGPLQDTVIQRWRDPADGTVCYVYLPIAVEHSPPTATGFVQYGANSIGSISCFAPNSPQAQAK